jgi:hypothetical protein
MTVTFFISLVRTSGDSVTRGDVYARLAYSRTEASWKVIIDGLDEKHFMAYVGCLKALVNRGDTRAVGPLIAELSKPPRIERFPIELGRGKTAADRWPGVDMRAMGKIRTVCRSESRMYPIERCLADILGDQAPAGWREEGFDWAAWYRKNPDRQ